MSAPTSARNSSSDLKLTTSTSAIETVVTAEEEEDIQYPIALEIPQSVIDTFERRKQQEIAMHTKEQEEQE